MYAYDGGGSPLDVATIGLGYHTGSKLQESLTGDGGRIEGSRSTLVSTLANALNHRYLTQERNLHLRSELLHSLMTKEEVALIGMLGRSEP